MADIQALFEDAKKNQKKLNRDDTKFLSDLHVKFQQNSDITFSMKQAKWLNDIRRKLLSTEDNEPLFIKQKCNVCSGSGWLFPEGIGFGFAPPYVIYCECRGGPQELARILKINGDFDLAERVLNNPVTLESG